LRRFDELAVEVESNAEPVTTHGEPHPGNLIALQDRVVLVDWDTVALAPPERDLWMLDDGSTDSFARYSQATGKAVDSAAVTVYRLSWTLADKHSARGSESRKKARDHSRAFSSTVVSA
jgi:spectinomycin phosphotransferase